MLLGVIGLSSRKRVGELHIFLLMGSHPAVLISQKQIN